MTYTEKLRDPRWQKKRLKVMERDGFACRDCGDDKSQLQVHHCFYDKGEPWDTADEMLLTVCSDCHERRGPLEADAKRMLSQIMVRLECAPQKGGALADFVLALSRVASDPCLIPEVTGASTAADVDEGEVPCGR